MFKKLIIIYTQLLLSLYMFMITTPLNINWISLHEITQKTKYSSIMEKTLVIKVDRSNPWPVREKETFSEKSDTIVVAPFGLREVT